MPVGWLKGKTVRKGGMTTAQNTRSNTPQVQSTSSTLFGGGIKDASGNTTEYFVRRQNRRCRFWSANLRSSPWMTSVPYASRTGTSTQSSDYS